MIDPSYVVIIQGLKQCKCAFTLASNSLVAISDQVSSLPLGTLKGLVTTFATQHPRDFKNMVILTFHMKKLRPSYLGGDLMLSVMDACVYDKQMMQMND